MEAPEAKNNHVIVTVDNDTTPKTSLERPGGGMAPVRMGSAVSTSPSNDQTTSGDENSLYVRNNTDAHAAVTLVVDNSVYESQEANKAASRANAQSAPKPLESVPASAEQPTLHSTVPQVFRDPAGSAWGGADTAKAIKSLSSCPSSLSRKGSQSLGHEGLFSAGLFTADDWKAHTSYRRWLPEPVYLFKVVRGLLVPLATVLLACAGCAVYEEVIRKEKPSWGSLHNLEANFAYSLCSFALALLLIFKTNSSYGRFWEARSAWANLQLDCRTFILKMQAHASPDCPLHLRKALMRWTITLPYVMRTHLLDYEPGVDALEELLTNDEVAWLRRPVDGLWAHQPMRAAGVLMSLAKKLNLPAPAYVDTQNLMKSFLSHCGTCEKLSVTPIPMPYTRHTVRFILLYTAFMPIVLWRNLRWGTFVVAPVIAFAVAGIDTVGIYIENPNTILPMASYCRGIHQDVLLSGHEWAAAVGKGTAAYVERFLAGGAPDWQQESNANVQQQACISCVDAEDGDWATPDLYRRKIRNELASVVGR